MRPKTKIKTSRNIAGALKKAIWHNQVSQKYMAKDLRTTSPNISNQQTKKFDTPIDSAMQYSVYFNDPEFSQQMASIYFDAIAMFNPKEWADQFKQAPYAIWIKLRQIEKERLDRGNDVLGFAMEKREDWTPEQRKEALDWMVGLLKTISLASLMAKEFSEVAHYDLKSMEQDFNKEYGNLGV